MDINNSLLDLVVDALEQMKAVDIRYLDVHEVTSITDAMVVCSGTSARHVKSLSDNVLLKTKEAGHRPLGVEGENAGEWVLVDLGDVVVHIMKPDIREFYQLERLWSVEGTSDESDTSV